MEIWRPPPGVEPRRLQLQLGRGEVHGGEVDGGEVRRLGAPEPAW
jgi:hypothetical protein